MTLKAVLFDFSEVIINDGALRREVFATLAAEEALSFSKAECAGAFRGRSDRSAIAELLHHHNRSVSPADLDRWVARFAAAYHDEIATAEPLPLCPGIVEFASHLWSTGLVLGIVAGVPREAVARVLERAGLQVPFSTIVAGDDTHACRPDPEGHRLAIAQLATRHPNLKLTAANCLAIESSYVGITAARAAGLQVAGVANIYPCHLLQRRVDWVVDELRQLEVERISQTLVARGQC